MREMRLTAAMLLLYLHFCSPFSLPCTFHKTAPKLRCHRNGIQVRMKGEIEVIKRVQLDEMDQEVTCMSSHAALAAHLMWI